MHQNSENVVHLEDDELLFEMRGGKLGGHQPNASGYTREICLFSSFPSASQSVFSQRNSSMDLKRVKRSLLYLARPYVATDYFPPPLGKSRRKRLFFFFSLLHLLPPKYRIVPNRLLSILPASSLFFLMFFKRLLPREKQKQKAHLLSSPFWSPSVCESKTLEGAIRNIADSRRYFVEMGRKFKIVSVVGIH